MERVLLEVANRQAIFADSMDANRDKDYPLVRNHDAEEVEYGLVALMGHTLLEGKADDGDDRPS